MTPDELKQKVDTIVVVMMENRSFDNVLGYLRHPEFGNRTDVDGIEDLANPDYVNVNSDGEGKSPFWMADGRFFSDLPHGADEVHKQLKFAPLARRHLMTGFVEAFEEEFHSKVADPPVMGLLRPADLPTTSVLADHYTVCDRWFACVPTSTAPNRLMSMCGATALRDTHVLLPEQQTVYDWLSDHHVRWRVYAAGLPFFALMPRVSEFILTGHFRRIDDLARDLETEGPDEWPQVIFVEPDYYDCPVHFQPPCDNHPPLGMAAGEAFVAGVYRTLAASPRWQRSVFILTYDEHGGFFDHVAPLPVSYRNPNGAVAFETTGPRTPTIVAGPYAPRAASHVQLDNTSILQLIAERFGAAGESYSSEVLGRQHQGIASVTSILDAAANNTQICTFGAPLTSSLPTTVINSKLRTAFHNSMRELVLRHQTEAVLKYPELRGYLRAA
jgi:phospholipase C